MGTKVIDLIRPHLLDDPDQVGAVGEVAVVEGELRGLSLLTPLMRVLIEVIDPAGVEDARAAFDAVHLVALLQEELRQVAAVLSGMPVIRAVLGGGAGMGVLENERGCR